MSPFRKPFAAVIVALIATSAHGAPAAKKPTYDQLAKENAELRAQVDALARQVAELSRRLAALTPPATQPAAEIRKGMSLAEAQAIAGHVPKLIRRADDGTDTYELNVIRDPHAATFERHKYTVDVRDGKIAAYDVEVIHGTR